MKKRSIHPHRHNGHSRSVKTSLRHSAHSSQEVVEEAPPENTPRKEAAAAEILKKDADVKEALQGVKTKPVAEESIGKDAAKTEKKKWMSLYALIFFGAIGLSAFLTWAPSRFSFLHGALDPLLRIALGASFVAGVLILEKLIELHLLSKVDNRVTRFNFNRVLRLLTGILIALICLSLLFVNWTTAFVSLGLASLIMGFALQTPISSFIGWIYILIKKPYQIGDRIKIDSAKGDVIDVSYLDTTLWEFGGDYLSTDHPTGRIIKFPNSKVLSSMVYNYSWALFPYIWNEIKFQIAYDSDLEFVAKTMRETAEEELGEGMMEAVGTFRSLLAKTPVDHLEVREKPAAFFRVSENTWLEAIVRYLVHPKDAGRIKTRLIQKLLQRLNAAPERVLFPKSNAR